MRYKVFLKSNPEPIVVEADDMNLISAEEGRATGAYLNFWKAGGEGETDVTVAAVSFDEFRYAVAG